MYVFRFILQVEILMLFMVEVKIYQIPWAVEPADHMLKMVEITVA